MSETHRHRNTGRARDLRKNQTDAEQLLWRELRSRQLGGFKFRRQVPIGSAIADFVCDQARLIIEIDGGQHDKLQSKDDQRTAMLEERGYKVIRFWNNQVLAQTQDVLAEVLRILESNTALPISEQIAENT